MPAPDPHPEPAPQPDPAPPAPDRAPHPWFPTEDDLDALVTWTLIRAGRRWESVISTVLGPYGLSPVQFGTLAHLAASPQLTQSGLARRTLMRPQSMHHLLDTLTERGYVHRTSAERGSGRPNPIVLSPTGWDLLRQVWPVITHLNGPDSLGLDHTAITTLNTTLNHLVHHPGPDR